LEDGEFCSRDRKILRPRTKKVRHLSTLGIILQEHHRRRLCRLITKIRSPPSPSLVGRFKNTPTYFGRLLNFCRWDIEFAEQIVQVLAIELPFKGLGRRFQSSIGNRGAVLPKCSGRENRWV
jgi:hypothetical protein